MVQAKRSVLQAKKSGSARLPPFTPDLEHHHHSDLHKMGKITVLYFAAAMTATKLTSETLVVPDDGLKISDLAKLIVSRHPNTGIDRVLEGVRWCVDGLMLYDIDSFVVEDGREVAVIPPVSGG